MYVCVYMLFMCVCVGVCVCMLYMCLHIHMYVCVCVCVCVCVFDTVDPNILLTKLQAHGVSGTELDWFKSYLFNRKQYIVWNGANSTYSHLQCGVTQGSILGPLLFLI